MEKLELYEKVRSVPINAQKPIEGGRLKGKTDINPMWRIKTLTELFGACGFGWRYDIVRLWSEAGANGEITAFAHINLYIKQGDKWSEAIQGVGGNMLVEKEKAGLHTSDECYKMALTDAISVACKMLGFGADIYWDKDGTKYSKTTEPNEPPKPKPEPKQTKSDDGDYRSQLGELIKASKGKITKEMISETIKRKFGVTKANDLNIEQFDACVKDLREQAL